MSWGEPTYRSGTEGRSFEREFAAHLGRRHAVAVSNGTVALELALRSFGVGEGWRVAVPARSFIATVSSVVAVGATPVFFDIDPATNCIVSDIGDVDAVIPVHLGGWPAHTDFDCLVIEDCAQAHGGSAGRAGDGACYSFCGDKIISTGEGGMFLTDDDTAYEYAMAYRDHGRVEGCEHHPFFGTNWRMTEHAAMLGRAGLEKLDEWHRIRESNAHQIADGLAVLGIHAPTCEGHAYYRLYAMSDRRDELLGIAEKGSCAELYAGGACSMYAPSGPLPGARLASRTSCAFRVDPNEHVGLTLRRVREALCAS